MTSPRSIECPPFVILLQYNTTQISGNSHFETELSACLPNWHLKLLILLSALDFLAPSCTSLFCAGSMIWGPPRQSPMVYRVRVRVSTHCLLRRPHAGKENLGLEDASERDSCHTLQVYGGALPRDYVGLAPEPQHSLVFELHVVHGGALYPHVELLEALLLETSRQPPRLSSRL
jgi:hypothetical protein